MELFPLWFRYDLKWSSLTFYFLCGRLFFFSLALSLLPLPPWHLICPHRLSACLCCPTVLAFLFCCYFHLTNPLSSSTWISLLFFFCFFYTSWLRFVIQILQISERSIKQQDSQVKISQYCESFKLKLSTRKVTYPLWN